MCLDKTMPGYGDVPVDACAKNSESYNLTEWDSYVGGKLKDFTGETCTCEGSGCNYIKRE